MDLRASLRAAISSAANMEQVVNASEVGKAHTPKAVPTKRVQLLMGGGGVIALHSRSSSMLHMGSSIRRQAVGLE
eukprot:scaffold197822_cov14-Tisochrysis_lutea.AAC.1